MGHCAGTTWNIFNIRKAINPTPFVFLRVIEECNKEYKNKFLRAFVVD